jgi:hypothetical protein
VLSLEQALAELPDTASGIAAKMVELDCQGVPGDAYECPVANYLVRNGFAAASVSDLRIEVCDEDTGFTEIRTPTAIANFIKAFDEGLWPQLESWPEVPDA